MCATLARLATEHHKEDVTERAIPPRVPSGRGTPRRICTGATSRGQVSPCPRSCLRWTSAPSKTSPMPTCGPPRTARSCSACCSCCCCSSSCSSPPRVGLQAVCNGGLTGTARVGQGKVRAPVRAGQVADPSTAGYSCAHTEALHPRRDPGEPGLSALSALSATTRGSRCAPGVTWVSATDR